MPVDSNPAPEIPQDQPQLEVPVKRKRKKPGPPSLVPGEKSEKLTAWVPASIVAQVQKKCRTRSISEYLRKLIDADLKRAS